MKRLRYGAFVGLIVTLLVGGCDWADSTPSPGEGGLKPVEPVSNLQGFTAGDAELEAYLKEQFVSSVQPADYGYYWRNGDVYLVDTAGAPSAAGAQGDHSTTNIQEEGVDESDVVKNDGTYLYVATGSEVKIVQAVPADGMVVLSAIPANGPVDSLYLYGDLMVALYRLTSYYYYDPYYEVVPLAPDYDYYDPYSNPPPIDGIPEDRPYDKTGVLLVDITDRAAPVVLSEFLFEGGLAASRLTGGRLHLVQRFTPHVQGLRYWYDGTEEDLAAVEAQNQAIIDGLTLDDLVPAYYEVDSGTVVATGRAVEPPDFSRPDEPEGHSIITVVTIDLDDLSSGFATTAAVADAGIVYASTRALYLAHSIYSYTQDPQPPPLGGYDYSRQTVIRKFDLTAERVRNVASGRVWGYPLNQFSLGEHEGILRIATTTGHVSRSGESSSRNHVFCLAEAQGAHLEIAGSIENIAPGERIYSARFMGERGFLVTFKKVDPLFTLDLADPANPKVIGELKVPGYSDYIHPLGENHLLTIGKDTVEAVDGDFAWYQGVQLSVFDVTDFANPTLLHKKVIGDRGTSSEALHNHKAFTFWAERDLLAIPIYLCEGATQEPWQTAPHTFTGLYVYRVTAAGGIDLQGRIDTAPGGSSYYWSSWTRGIFIGDDVYAVTPDAVKAAATADMGGAVWSLTLPQ